VRTAKTRPVDRLEADRAAMLPLPPVAPALGWVNRVRLGRDCYVRLDSSDYSVDPAVIGRFVDVAADLSRVEVRQEGRLVAAHDRVWARGMTITDPTHLAAAKVLREQFHQPRPSAARTEHAGGASRTRMQSSGDHGQPGGLTAPSCPTGAVQLQVGRDLAELPQNGGQSLRRDLGVELRAPEQAIVAEVRSG
jgi:hypothetical protein